MLEAGKDLYRADAKAPLALKYLLITAVEAITDICQHLLAKVKRVPCDGYVDCIVKAGAQGILELGLTNRLRRLADLRNSLVNRYWIIDDDRLLEETVTSVDDLTSFQDQIKALLDSVPSG